MRRTRHKGAFIFPTTTPVHFDPEAAHASIDRIMSYRTGGDISDALQQGDEIWNGSPSDLHADIDTFVRLPGAVRTEEERMQCIADEMRDHLWRRLDVHGFTGNDREREDILGMDIELNAMGLDVWLSRMAAA